MAPNSIYATAGLSRWIDLRGLDTLQEVLGPKRRAALYWFAAGIAVGALVMQQVVRPDAVRATITPTAGEDSSAPKRQSRDHASQPMKFAAVAELPPAGPPSPPRSAAEIARKALQVAVFIRGGRAYGAGALLDDHGHVVTCAHVIEGVDAIEVTFADGAAFSAKVLERDRELDLALLEIASDRDPSFTAVSVRSVQVGHELFALGAPRKMRFSFSRGMASFVGRRFERVYYLQTDLPMNPGSSGGPVFNERGQVVALSSFVLRESEGLAFALPIDYVFRRFAGALHGRVLEGDADAAFENWLASREQPDSASD